MIRTANLTGSISRKAGGLHDSVRRLVQCVSEKGVAVRVLGIRDEFSEEDLPFWDPIEVDLFTPTGPHFFGYAPGFMKALNEYRPDLTHTHGIWLYPSIATRIYGSRHRVPYMISPHGMLDPWALRHHRWKKVLAYAAYEGNHVKDARCIRALCDSEARSIRQLNFKSTVAVIPNGIDLPENGNSKDSRDVPWDGIVKPGRKVMLFLSRIHQKKGLANLLKAWRQVRHSPLATRQSREWVLAIAGWDQGGHEHELKRLANDLGISWRDVRAKRTSNVKNSTPDQESLLFLGPQFNNQKAACYANCDAFILPSFSEGVPMVILEAWAYGKPVLMTPECNLPIGFQNEAAIHIETSTESIGLGLQRLFEMSDRNRVDVGRKGRNLVEGRFTWDAVACQLKETYDWMLGGGSAPPWVLTE